MKLHPLIQLMRPHQYVKNMFIFLPLFFALKITNLALLFNSLLAFIAFSIAASAIYIFNDYHDIEEDRQHPKKRLRPLAAEDISKYHAILMLLFLASAGIILMAIISTEAMLILIAYLAINIAYTIYLKHIAILDVTIIAIGFVLRLFVGAAVIQTPLTVWIVVMTFLLALFLALAKRRDDVLIYLETGEKMRKVIDGYNLQFLDGAMMIMGSVVIVAYTIYTTSPAVIEHTQNEYLYLTALFVILGILRYLQIAFVEKNSSSPSRIVLTDRFIQLTLLGWILTFTWIIY